MISSILFSACLHFLMFAFCFEDESVQKFVARGFDEFGEVTRFLQESERKDFSELRHHSNLKVSFYAAWVQCRINGKLTKDPNSSDCRREFLGFVSGRLGMELPVWWCSEIVSMDFTEQVALRGNRVEARTGLTETNGVKHPEEVDLKLSEKDLEIIRGKSIFKVNAIGGEWLDEDRFMDGDPFTFAFAETADGRVIFGTADKFENRFKLYCSDRRGVKLWSAEIDQLSQLNVGNACPGRSSLAIVTTGRNVAVFWVTDLAVKLDVFDIETGSPVSRFTTLFELPDSILALPHSSE